VVEVYDIRMALGKIALTYLLSEEGRLTSIDLKRIEALAENEVGSTIRRVLQTSGNRQLSMRQDYKGPFAISLS
jgi:hypothetical protein